jgi:hypothetical protein
LSFEVALINFGRDGRMTAKPHSFRSTRRLGKLPRAILCCMSKEKPPWLQATREFCGSVGIEICGWGTDTLVVKTVSRDDAAQVASQFRSLGFEPIEDEDDASAGLLTLSRVPAATLAKQQCGQSSSTDISRPPSTERITAAVLASLGICVILFAAGSALISFSSRSGSWFSLFGLGAMMILLATGSGLTWKLQITPTKLLIRRWLPWSAIPWSQIRSVQMGEASRGRRRVMLVLMSDSTLNLGTFPGSFACVLRDRLREEVSQHLD